MLMISGWRDTLINQVTWFEKYRPDTLSDFVCDDNSRKRYQHIIDTNLNQHFLFGGNAGTGKTTLSEIICKTIDCDYITINGSDETSVDDIRGKVKTFVTTSSFTNSSVKVVIYDEMEYLSKSGQAMMRKFMEQYVHLSRFILCCNELDKVIEPIKSRCAQMNLKPPTPILVRDRLKYILDNENIKYEIQNLNDIVNVFYNPSSDFRRVINELQNHSIGGELMKCDLSLNEDYNELITGFEEIDFNFSKSWKIGKDGVMNLLEHKKNGNYIIDKEVLKC